MVQSTQAREMGLIILLGMLTAVSPLSTDMYLPGLPQLRADFGVSESAVQHTLSTFFVGLAVGQLLLGPLSDRLGRRLVMHFGLMIYLLGSALCLASGTIGMLVAARALQGLGAAVGPVISRAVVRDRFHGAQAARVLSFVIMVMAAAPLVAPSIGGIVVGWWGWRAIFMTLTAYGVLALVLAFWRLAETHPEERRRGTHLWGRFQAYATVLARPYAVAQLLTGGLAFGGLFAYLAAAPFVFMAHFGITAEQFGFFFAANVGGMMVVTYLNGRLVIRHGTHRLLRLGVAILAASGVALAVVAAAGQPGLVSVTLLLFACVSVIGLIGSNTVANLLDLFPHNAGAASALFGVFQFALGAATSAVVGKVAGDPITGIALVMAATGCGALAVQGLCAYFAPGTGSVEES